MWIIKQRFSNLTLLLRLQNAEWIRGVTECFPTRISRVINLSVSFGFQQELKKESRVNFIAIKHDHSGANKTLHL